MAAAEASDVQALVARLRGKGLDDQQVRESLQGMGYTNAEAQAAVPSSAPPPQQPAPAKPSPSARGGRAAGGSRTGATSTPPGKPAASGTPTGLSMPKAPDLSGLTLTPPRRISGGDVAGFLAGLTLYAVALNFIRYGAAGPKGWLSAKFLNRPLDITTPGATENNNNDNGLVSTRPATV